MAKLTARNPISTEAGSAIETNLKHPNRTEVAMDDLPELPFEKVLSYLSLEEVIKLRAVSRSCLWKIDNYKVKSLCYSEVPIERIYERNRWVSGAYAQNFIVSTKFESFFKTFGRSILSHLKRLRLYAPDLRVESPTAFTDAINSFSYLEELDLIGKWYSKKNRERRELELNLPMLKSVQFKEVRGIEKFTLNAPMLKKVKLKKSRLFLDLVHGESVECLHVESSFKCVKVSTFKNLKYAYLGPVIETRIDFPSLISLEHLKAIHLTFDDDVHQLFDLKQRYGRADLQIYRHGYLLNGPDDPEMRWDADFFNVDNYFFLNPSRLADEMPLHCFPIYPSARFWRLAPESQAIILNRLTGLSGITLEEPVQDIDRFLNFLNTFNHIAYLQVDECVQLQPLLNRLPEYSGLQHLDLVDAPSDYEFLFRLKNLIELDLQFSVDTATIRRALEDLPLLEYLVVYPDSPGSVLDIYIESPKRFKVTLREKELQTCDLDAVIQFIQQNVAELG